MSQRSARRTSATSTSGPTPRAISSRASRLAARIELRIGERCVSPDTTADRVRGARRPAPAKSSGSVAAAPAAPVSFHSARTCGARRRRECRCGRPAGRVGGAASSSRTSRAAIGSAVAWSNRSVAYSMRRRCTPAGVPAVPLSARSASGRTWRSPRPTGSTRHRQPGQVQRHLAGGRAVFCSTSITWNSGWRACERAGLSTSTSRSNGTS